MPNPWKRSISRSRSLGDASNLKSCRKVIHILPRKLHSGKSVKPISRNQVFQCRAPTHQMAADERTGRPLPISISRPLVYVHQSATVRCWAAPDQSPTVRCWADPHQSPPVSPLNSSGNSGFRFQLGNLGNLH